MHSSSVAKNNQLMLYREIITICSEVDTTQRNIICGHRTVFLHVETWWYMEKRGMTMYYAQVLQQTDHAVLSQAIK
jgi:hypothetical protein